MKKFFPVILNLLFLCFSLQTYAQDKSEKHSIYFETADYTLDENAQQILTELSVILNKYADYSIDIQAHTDNKGDTDYNRKLAENRATSVQNFLLNKGIIVDNLTATAFGESKPDFANTNEDGRARNRRVDLHLTALKAIDFATVKEKWQQDLAEKFTVDGNKKTQILGKKGTKVWLDENTFVFADGSIPTGDIEVKLTECYSFGDMLLADLTTMSGDKILETGGMMKIEAFSDGQELVVAAGKTMQFAAPTQKFDPKMQLFYGTEHPEEDRLEDWQLADNSITNRIDRNSPYLGPRAPDKPTPLIFTRDSTFMPRKPTKPTEKRYRALNFPDTMSVYTKVKGGVFTNKNKVAAERKKKIDKMMKRYEKSIARQEYNKKAYLESVVKYEKQSTEYPEKMKEWEKEVKQKEVKFYASENYKSLTEARNIWYEKARIRYGKAKAAHKELQRKRSTDFETEYEKNGTISADAMNYYFFQVNQSGWINCDRFSDAPKRELLVFRETNPTREGNVYAVFKKSNSIIRLRRDATGNIIDESFPSGQLVSIIGWKVENGQPMLAQSDAIIGKKIQVNLTYRKVHLRELKDALTGI